MTGPNSLHLPPLGCAILFFWGVLGSCFFEGLAKIKKVPGPNSLPLLPLGVCKLLKVVTHLFEMSVPFNMCMVEHSIAVVHYMSPFHNIWSVYEEHMIHVGM